MKFLTPAWLWLMPLIAIAGLLVWLVSSREFRRRLEAFAAPRAAAALLSTGVLTRVRWRLAFLVMALLALGLALARPLGGLRSQSAAKQGVNVLIALDASASMLAEDVSPSRFALTQIGIRRLVDQMDGDRGGLLLFGGQANLIVPLTFDSVSMKLVVRSLHPELVGKAGSSLSEVIVRSAELFRKQPAAARVLVIFSDGEETDGDAVLAAEQAFREDGMRIFTIGVGTPGGATIPLLARNAQRELVRVDTVRDEENQEIISRLDERLLRRIAEVGGGEYLNLTTEGVDFREWYARLVKPLAAPLDDIQLTDYTEWFQLPLALALLLLVAEYLPRRHASKPAQRKTAASVPAGARGLVVVALLGSVLVTPTQSSASTSEVQQLIREGKFQPAVEQLQETLLKDPDDLLARYNYAVGTYAAGKYSLAVELFDKLAGSMDYDVEPRSRFQLGNSHYRLGEEMRKKNPDGAIAQWEKALIAYQKAIEVPAATANFQKARRDLVGLHYGLAQEMIAAGDTEARVSSDHGIPAWRIALTHLDKGIKLTEDPDETKILADLRIGVADRIYGAFFEGATDKRRRAEMQQQHALERAIELLSEAVTDYTEALAIRPGDVPAKTGLEEAQDLLDPWQVEWGDRLHAKGNSSREISLNDAIAAWDQAGIQYARVLERTPDYPGALAGREKNNLALHDGHVAAGDYQQGQADAGRHEPAERDALLESALAHYEKALALQPGNVATQDKRQAVGRKLTETFVARGFTELNEGKAIWEEGQTKEGEEAQTWLADAIASVERAVQSFVRALEFDPEHERGLAGRKEAEELLKKLRELDASEKRKLLGDGKEMKDPQEMEDPGKLALQLLDFKDDHLASKKQQNLIAPENRPAKHW